MRRSWDLSSEKVKKINKKNIKKILRGVALLGILWAWRWKSKSPNRRRLASTISHFPTTSSTVYSTHKSPQSVGVLYTVRRWSKKWKSLSKQKKVWQSTFNPLPFPRHEKRNPRKSFPPPLLYPLRRLPLPHRMPCLAPMEFLGHDGWPRPLVHSSKNFERDEKISWPAPKNPLY